MLITLKHRLSRLPLPANVLLIRAIIIIALLLIAAYIGRSSNRMIPLAFAAVFGGYVLLRWFNLGLVALFFAGTSVAASIPTGTMTNLNLALLLVPVVLLIWIVSMIRNRKLQIVPTAANAPIVLFIASVCISFIGGNMPWSYHAGLAPLPAQLGGIALLILSPLLMVVVANTQQNTRVLKLFIIVLLVFAVITTLSRVNGEFYIIAEFILRTGATGGMFWVWTAAFAAGICLYHNTLRISLRILAGVIAIGVLAISMLVTGDWSSGWVPPLVVMGVLLALRSKSYAIAVVVAAVVFLIISQADVLRLLIEQENYSLVTRQAALEIMIENVIPLSPIMGLGPANYYFYTPLFSIMGYYLPFNSHNQYLDLLAQLGVVGTSIYLWLMVTCAIIAWKLRTLAAQGFNRAYAYCCIAGIAGTLWAGLHGDWVLPFVYNIGIEGFRASMLVWIFLGGLVAIENQTRAEQANKAP